MPAIRATATPIVEASAPVAVGRRRPTPTAGTGFDVGPRAWQLTLPTGAIDDLSLKVNAGEGQIGLPGAQIGRLDITANAAQTTVDLSEAYVSPACRHGQRGPAVVPPRRRTPTSSDRWRSTPGPSRSAPRAGSACTSIDRCPERDLGQRPAAERLGLAEPRLRVGGPPRRPQRHRQSRQCRDRSDRRMQVNRRLYRCRHDKRLAGVASGVAEYFEVDPSLVRVFWVPVDLPRRRRPPALHRDGDHRAARAGGRLRAGRWIDRRRAPRPRSVPGDSRGPGRPPTRPDGTRPVRGRAPPRAVAAAGSHHLRDRPDPVRRARPDRHLPAGVGR